MNNIKKTVFIHGYSAAKNLNGYLLTKNQETRILLKLYRSVEPKLENLNSKANEINRRLINTAQKMKKSLMENFIFCAVKRER